MRILYTHYLTDAAHPAVQMVEHIARELRMLGHDVCVYDSAGLVEPTDRQAGSSSPRHSFFQSLKDKLWFAKAMARNRGRIKCDRRVIRSFEPDVVLARQDAYCWSVVQAAKETGITCVTYADAPVAYESRMFDRAGRWHPPMLVERLERWGLRQSEAIITVSNPAASRLKTYNLDTPIHVIHNGIDPTRFPERRSNQGKKIVIGFQGTFKAFHGIDRLRELMLWTEGRNDTTWLLIGDGPERAALEAAVKDRVDAQFVGRQPPEAMGELLSSIDIAIAPHSQMKGDFYFCPLKILEYAASGCATIASRQGDIPALLANGQGGEIVDDDRLESWTTALERLIENEEHRRRLGTTARDHVMENLTWSHTAAAVEQVLQQQQQSLSPSRERLGEGEQESLATHTQF